MTDSPVTTKPITIDEFEAFLALPENQDRRFELIHGEIVEQMPNEYHNLISGNLYFLLRLFLQNHDLGQVTYETRYRANPDDSENDRIPDISFTTRARLMPVVTQGAVPQIPDLCIEIQSPNDYPKQMRDKAYYYLKNGAQQVWLIYTRKSLIEGMYPDGQSDFYYPGDTLTGGDLLPGFEVALETIFKVRE
ncbi:MAG: Uma2 family endonuclease [Anaerolineae bacterium]|nr:Uma2 family endonuclease [Anaerolineae bacterium]